MVLSRVWLSWTQLGTREEFLSTWRTKTPTDQSSQWGKGAYRAGSNPTDIWISGDVHEGEDDNPHAGVYEDDDPREIDGVGGNSEISSDVYDGKNDAYDASDDSLACRGSQGTCDRGGSGGHDQSESDDFVLQKERPKRLQLLPKERLSQSW